MERAVLVPLLLVVLLLAVIAFQQIRTPEFEYAIITPPDEELRTELDSLGRQGYEIVAARRAVGSEDKKPAYELILKRRR